MKIEDKNINFILTEEQIEMICKTVGKKPSEMEEYEICELLDKIIDDYVITNS